jgi:hypothetical protein
VVKPFARGVISTLAGLLATSLLLACASSSTSQRLQARLAPATHVGPLECGACKPEWERAQLWLVRHSHERTQLASELVIRTSSPGRFDSHYGFTVTREPVPGSTGGYRVALAMSCGSVLQACDPAPADVRRAFFHYLATGRDVLEGAGSLGALR